MTDVNVQEESISKLKSECKFYKNRSQFYSVIFHTLVFAVVVFITWMFSILSVVGVGAIDNQLHLSQFTTAMATIFLNLAPMLMCLYACFNYLNSLYNILYDEIDASIKVIKKIANGVMDGIRKADST